MKKIDAVKAMLEGKFVRDPEGYKWRLCNDWFQYFDDDWEDDGLHAALQTEPNEGWELVKEPLRIEFETHVEQYRYAAGFAVVKLNQFIGKRVRVTVETLEND